MLLWRGSLLWRGGLPPFGCEAVAKHAHAIFMKEIIVWFGSASHSNGGEPPHHKMQGVSD
ncbi:hypothetical protein AM274_08740 [Pseudomonas nunensis]|nr:hypothetical protein AM274_08740 [Pseudomonas nunensis]